MSRETIAVLAPGPFVAGGQSVQAQALVAALRSDGRQVDFLPTDPVNAPGWAAARRLPFVRTLCNLALYLPSLRRLARARTALIFSASYWSFVLAPLPALCAARLFGVRAILVYHSGEADDHLTRWRRFLAPCLRLADRIVVPSEFLRDVFARHGHATLVIPNVVDLRAFAYRERVPLLPRLLSARSLEAPYGVDNTVRAFALLKRRRPDATLTVAGGGRELPQLRRLAERLGVGGVRFLGAVRPEAMPRLMDEADLFVNSSTVDNQPVSLLEAFAAGTPVVSTGAGGIARMVRDGENGRLVPAGDPRAMAEAIDDLLERPEGGRALARRAREEVLRHSWHRVRPLWDEVAGGGRSR
jgi:glycosyltransferase involved in cell wall biosynthesis